MEVFVMVTGTASHDLVSFSLFLLCMFSSGLFSSFSLFSLQQLFLAKHQHLIETPPTTTNTTIEGSFFRYTTQDGIQALFLATFPTNNNNNNPPNQVTAITVATGNSTMYDPAIAMSAARVAEIHVLAMQSNPLLHAQFPTPESQAALQNFLAKEAYPKIMSVPPEDGVRIITREKGGRGDIVGFLMWDYPSPLDHFGPPPQDKKKKKLEEGEILNVPGCRREYLEEYARLAKEAKERSGYNQKRCWHLTFLCIDPEHQGQGLATDMMKQFLDMVEYLHEEFGQLPVYLESTTEAVSMYERLGFETEDWFEMKIPAMRKGGCSKRSEGEGQSEGEEEMITYREVCMVYYPGARFRRISPE